MTGPPPGGRTPPSPPAPELLELEPELELEVTAPELDPLLLPVPPLDPPPLDPLDPSGPPESPPPAAGPAPPPPQATHEPMKASPATRPENLILRNYLMSGDDRLFESPPFRCRWVSPSGAAGQRT
jgi:hypothetical protein